MTVAQSPEVAAAVTADREKIAETLRREKQMYEMTARFARDPELIALRIEALDRYIGIVLAGGATEESD